MHTYTDTANRQWLLDLTTYQAMRIKSMVGIDILEWGDTNLFDKLGKDPLVFAEIAWLLVEKQATQKSIDKDQFLSCIDGEGFEVLSDMVLQEIIDFFPQQKKALLQKIVQVTTGKQQQAISLLNTRLDVGS